MFLWKDLQTGRDSHPPVGSLHKGRAEPIHSQGVKRFSHTGGKVSGYPLLLPRPQAEQEKKWRSQDRNPHPYAVLAPQGGGLTCSVITPKPRNNFVSFQNTYLQSVSVEIRR